MPEGQTEVERRYLKSRKKPVQMQKNNIFARIPLPPQCAHWGTFPPGEGFMTASQLLDKLQFVLLDRREKLCYNPFDNLITHSVVSPALNRGY